MASSHKYGFTCTLSIHIDVKDHATEKLVVPHTLLSNYILNNIYFTPLEVHIKKNYLFLYGLLPIVIPIFIVDAEVLIDWIWYMDAKLVCSNPILWFDFGNDPVYKFKHILCPTVERILFLYSVTGFKLKYFDLTRAIEILQWSPIFRYILTLNH